MVDRNRRTRSTPPRLARLLLWALLPSDAFAVSSRTSEFGLRMALGATRAEVLGSTLGQGASQLASGVAIGSVIGLWLSRGLARQLYGVEPWDPAVFLAVVAVLVGTGLAACFIPAHRATRIDPVIALRHE